ncbi:MAG: translation initiation factor, partial [Chthoniobacterales bacterium]
HRVATEAAPELRTNPFAALDLGPLRDAPANSPTAQLPPKKEPKEHLLLRRSTAHRGGKTVLVLEGFSPAWTGAKLEALLHELKTSLGCGGKIEARTLELQGELAERLIPLLENRDFAVKKGW